MIIDEIKHTLSQNFEYEMTAGQKHVIDVFADFLLDDNEFSVMLLRGSAGTGKTSLIGSVVENLPKIGYNYILLAPTGRAAKVFSNYSNQNANTIHRTIYIEKEFNGAKSSFLLDKNKGKDTIFIVDEASMVSNQDGKDSFFGSGNLLKDLIKYVYNRKNCRLMLIGDNAQLPPIGESMSPALCADILETYDLGVYECNLTEVLRQNLDSGILFNAIKIRNALKNHTFSPQPLIRFKGFKDIKKVSGSDIVEEISNSYSEVGIDETIVITRSNKLATRYNNGIRRMVLDYEDELSQGDMVMVVKNNYYWVEKEQLPIPFIANGDRAKITSVRNINECYGLEFADVELYFPDYEIELRTKAILNSLKSDAPALTKEESEKLFNGVLEDYSHLKTKKSRYKAVREDQLYNAFQLKYACAITCHKAQGGQWEHVYIDQGFITPDKMDVSYYHWLYTAFTRSKGKLFLVNWQTSQTEQK